MKTKIKRHSHAVLSVVLAVCMVLSCMTVGLIATDAAKVNDQGAVGASTDTQPATDEGAALDNDETADLSESGEGALGANLDEDSPLGAANVYAVYGSWDSWTAKTYFSGTTGSATATVSLTAGTTYEFKIYSSYGKCSYGADNTTFTASQSEYYFNTSKGNAKIKASVTGTYTFTLKREDNGDGAVNVGITFPTAATNYTITKASTTNGSFTVSKTSATAGTSINVTATPNRGYKLSTVSVTGATVTGSGNTRTFTMPSQNVTVTVTFTAAEKRTITASTGGNGTITLRVSSGGQTYAAVTTTGTAESSVTAYDGETVTATASPASGYQLSTFKRGTTNINSGDTWNVNAAATYTATFTTKTYSNQYTASLGSGTDNTYNKVKASFYDYYTDGEFNSGTPNWIKGIKDAERGENQGTCYPNDTLNKAIRDYTHTNSLTYPLYFGNFYNIANKNINSYSISDAVGWNFYNQVNNSQGLGNPASTYEYYSVTGLTGKTLSTNGIPNHYQSGENNENGAEMKLFDRDWLSESSKNGKGELATIIDSQFPVKKTTEQYGSGSHDYYSFDSATDNLWFENIESGYDNSKVYLEQSNCSSSNWYAHFFDAGNTKTKDVKMTPSGSYFTANNPDPTTYTKVIFCRMSNGNAPDSTWSNVWNQTNTLDYPDGSDNELLYTLSGYGSGKLMNGSWGEYSGATKKTIAPTVNYSTANADAVYSPNYGNRGFYPFDHKHAGTSSTNNRAWDLGFGVSLEIKFTLGPNGKTADGAEQVFTYSGDDDLWVFVDDQLILDLGGDHKQSEGTINFATKKVTVPKSIKAPGSSATRNTDFTLEDKTVHTMKIFYMERGMFDSNLKFGFSMYPYEDTYEVEKKVDTNGLNAGLAGQFSDEFTFENTAADGKGDGVAYEVFNTSTNAFVRNDTTNTSRDFTIKNGQYAKFSNIFTVNQNLRTKETPRGYYQYDTSYQVIDMQNNDNIVKAGNVSLTDPDGLTTGNFNFLTTLEGADPELDITHLRTIFTNKLKTESFMITKEIQGYDDADTAFPFIVTIKMSPGGGLSDINFNTQGLVYTSSLDNGTHTLGADGLGYIHEGEFVQFDGIPVGAKVTVYEPVTGTKYTPNTTGNANCYKNVTINSANTDNNPQYNKRGNNNSDVTFQLNGFDTITIVNEPKNYRMDYQLPTRLYGEKIYKLTGFITPAMVAQGYVEIKDAQHTAYLTTKFVSEHIPYETIFMKNVVWKSKTANHNLSKNGIDDYVILTATTGDQKLTVNVDTDGNGSFETTVENLDCGSSILLDGKYITGTKPGATPSYWNIYSTDTGEFVTRCYSTDLMYVAYDNYQITAVYEKGKNTELYDDATSATVNNLGITRSHWNDTTTGVDDSKDNYNAADTEYDRLYLDIELAYEAQGKMINTFTKTDVSVGYDICILNNDNTLNKVYKTIDLENTDLNNKNRIHAYYGFKNSENNRGLKLGIRAFVIDGSTTAYSEVMPFELNTVGSKGLSAEYDDDRVDPPTPEQGG